MSCEFFLKPLHSPFKIDALISLFRCHRYDSCWKMCDTNPGFPFVPVLPPRTGAFDMLYNDIFEIKMQSSSP